MAFIKHLILNLVLLFILDSIWLKGFAGSFFAKQLKEIGRFTQAGDFNVRILPGIFVYLLMAVAVEVFLFQNASIRTAKEYVLYGALLGLVVYGVFDGTNRAIIENYPLPMVLVDVAWGTFLFAAIAYVNFELRRRFDFL